MAAPTSQLFRFKIDLSDVERSVYQDLDFRVAQHPSEGLPFLLTRVIAYILNFQEDLVFSPEGLHNPDDPCLSIVNPQGGLKLWIEIGSPAARKLHKASKASQEVKVYTYKNPDHLVRDIASGNVHNAQKIALFSISQDFLSNLASDLERDNRWNFIYNDGGITITTKNNSFQSELRRHSL